MSLGGVRDEAEIRGIGAPISVPCRARSSEPEKGVKTNNPVFCLDEIEKMSMDFRGDRPRALSKCSTRTELLVQRPLSRPRLRFVPRCSLSQRPNNLHSIPPPLRNRIGDHPDCRLHGIRQVEHREEFPHHQQCKANGISPENVVFSDDIPAFRYPALHEGKRECVPGAGNRFRVPKGGPRKWCPGSAMPGSNSRRDHPGVSRHSQSTVTVCAEEKEEIGLAVGLAMDRIRRRYSRIETVTIARQGQGDSLRGNSARSCRNRPRRALSYVRSRASPAGYRARTFTRNSIFTFTCLKEPSRRTALRPGSPWPHPSFPR